MTAKKIEVPASPTQPQIEAGLRQAVLIIAPVLTYIGFMEASGWLSAALVIVGPLATIVSFVWGQLHTRSTAQKSAAMANKLDDSIASTK